MIFSQGGISIKNRKEVVNVYFLSVLVLILNYFRLPFCVNKTKYWFSDLPIDFSNTFCKSSGYGCLNFHSVKYSIMALSSFARPSRVSNAYIQTAAFI